MVEHCAYEVIIVTRVESSTLFWRIFDCIHAFESEELVVELALFTMIATLSVDIFI